MTPEAVLVGGHDKQLHALDPKTGRQLWAFACKGRIDGSPVVAGDRVFFGSADGRLYGLSVATGEQLWQFEAGGEILASPAVADGRLVIGNDSGNLYCFGRSRIMDDTPAGVQNERVHAWGARIFERHAEAAPPR